MSLGNFRMIAAQCIQAGEGSPCGIRVRAGALPFSRTLTAGYRTKLVQPVEYSRKAKDMNLAVGIRPFAPQLLHDDPHLWETTDSDVQGFSLQEWKERPSDCESSKRTAELRPDERRHVSRTNAGECVGQRAGYGDGRVRERG